MNNDDGSGTIDEKEFAELCKTVNYTVILNIHLKYFETRKTAL